MYVCIYVSMYVSMYVCLYLKILFSLTLKFARLVLKNFKTDSLVPPSATVGKILYPNETLRILDLDIISKKKIT